MNETKAILARDTIVEQLRTFLVGPLEELEEIRSAAPAFETPHDRYHCGFLSPAGKEIDPNEDDQDSNGGDLESGAGDSILTLANVKEQSAMGMTFQVQGLQTPLLLVVRWGEYKAVEFQLSSTDNTNSERKASEDVPDQSGSNLVLDNRPSAEQEEFGRRVTLWKRMSVSKPIELPLAPSEPGKSKLVEDIDGVKIWVKTIIEGDVRIVTTSIVNQRPDTRDGTIDNRLYQVELNVTSPTGGAAFVARPPRSEIDDPEFWTFELLYREEKQFAVGHGCAVTWGLASPDRASQIRTAWIPDAKVAKASPLVLEDDEILLLAKLSDRDSRSTTCISLERLPNAYQSWIGERRQEIPDLLKTFPVNQRLKVENAALQNLAQCERACERIREGIATLQQDERAWTAFCLANKAMSLSMQKSRPDKTPRWFAFQLAFILLCVPSVVKRDHPDRRTLDLLWFPTGGGKTEAYLGLAALCIFLRRLSASTPNDGHGTSVLTRYTLRLLTIQQFDRSARLICACEVIRRSEPDSLGTIPFSIGLFVGQGATPNSLEQAKELLIGDAGESEGVTTLPLKKCPWCGVELTSQNQSVKDQHLVTRCPGATCDFKAGLPLMVVDEEIYIHRPTMVIATVDKFANMAWSPDMGTIFSAGLAGSGPPNLIIQDELHLINDALGTMAALYETAIDYLCSRGGACPKIIGSTATIRHAREQCFTLFVRDAAAFPPNGTLVSDSFFYKEERPERPGRLYVGVHAQGRSPKHTLARLLGIVSQSSVRIDDPKVRDSYHTIVTYFNSLRELGGALVLAEDDVPRYIRAMPLPPGTNLRALTQIKELTSHVPQSMLSEVFRELETPIFELSTDYEREAIDLLFTTNMISVGVDVDRLGLMVINGQPKTTAEYIQASSRVGRPSGGAGLVIVLYNWTRPRDRSHYERFVGYHRAFYRYVESSSVTPFSPRARDRALHAVLVSMTRIAEKAFAANDSAGAIGKEMLRRRVEELAAVIVARAAEVDPEEEAATRSDLGRLIEQWHNEVLAGRRQDWQRKGRGGSPAMLRSPEKVQTAQGLWPTPRSMRDVEPPSPIVLLSEEELDNAN